MTSEASNLSAPSPSQSGPPPRLPQVLTRLLDRVRVRHLLLQLWEFPVLLAAGLAFFWLLQGLADRLLVLSWEVRCTLLALNGLGALVLAWFFFMRPLLRRMNRRRAALLVERKLPQFHTALISAVELSDPAAEYPTGSRALVRQLIEDVTRQAGKAGYKLIRQALPSRRLKKQILWTGAILLAAGGCFAAFQPLSTLLLRRILLSNAPFPSDTTVEAISTNFSVDAGAEALLSARAVGVIPPQGKLLVTYGNGKVESVIVSASGAELSIFSHAIKNVRESFRYRFELNDGIGQDYEVKALIPPSLLSIRFVQTYPAYTGLPETVMSPANLKLMEGATLKVTATASEPLSGAVMEIKTLPDPLPMTVGAPDATTLQAELTVPGSGWQSMSLHLTSTDREPSVNDPVYRIELVRDNPPLVSLTAPKKDEFSAVPTEKIPLAFKIGDDFGLKRAELCYRVFRPGTTGKPDALEPAEQGKLPIALAPGERAINRAMDWELARLLPAVTPGCSITFWIEGEDNNPAKTASVARSVEKSVRIVSEEQKRMEFLDLLGERAKDLEKLYDLQRQVNERTDATIR